MATVQAVTGNKASGVPSPLAARIKVLLIDRHQLLAQALAIVLQNDPDLEVVGSPGDPELALAHVRQTLPDVALLSYALLLSDGVGLAAELRAASTGLKLIVLTAGLDDETLFTCAQAGAVGCVTRESPPDEVIHAIKRVYAGEVLFAPDVLVRLLREAPRQHAGREHRASTQPLAPRELDVLRALAAGLSTEEAAERLGITTHTLRTHVKSLTRKLEARSKLEAVMIALRAGLIDLPE